MELQTCANHYAEFLVRGSLSLEVRTCAIIRAAWWAKKHRRRGVSTTFLSGWGLSSD